MRNMSPARLGQKGEVRFEEIGIDADWTVNKAGRDENGWDFLVELPAEASQHSLDTRQSVFECKFQIKVTSNKNGKIRIKLSAAEQLVKYKSASFVLVFIVDSFGSFIKMILIHTMGVFGEKILTELRKSELDNGLSINKKFVEINASTIGRELDINGKVLDAEVSQCIGDRNNLFQRKETFLKECGFDGKPFSGSMNVKFNKKQELMDFFLGKTTLQAQSVSFSERRFGIELKKNIGSDGIVKLGSPGFSADITFWSEVGRVQFPVRGIPIPGFAQDSGQNSLILKNKFFEMNMQNEAKISLQIGIRAEETLSFADYILMAKTQYVINKNRTKFEIHSKNKKPIKGSFTVHFGEENDEQVRSAHEYAMQWADILTKTQEEWKKIEMSEKLMSDAFQFIQFIDAASRTTSGASINFQISEIMDTTKKSELDNIESLIMLKINMTKSALCACIIGMTKIQEIQENTNIFIENLSLRDVSIIEDSNEKYKEYQERYSDLLARDITLVLGDE